MTGAPDHGEAVRTPDTTTHTAADAPTDAEAASRAPVRIVVVGDSLAATDESGPRLPDEPVLWPNVLARELAVRRGRPVGVTTVGRPGTDVREALTMLHKDPHVRFDLVARADAVVVAVGSLDHAPRGTPPWLDALVPFLRPAPLRRWVRRAVRRANPWLVRSTGGRRLRTPRREFDRRYALLLDEVRGLSLGRAIGVALGPTSHRAAHHGHRHPRHAEREAHQLALAAAHGYLTVPAWEHVRAFADRLNPDGVHWPAEAHEVVGRALADVLAGPLADALDGPTADALDGPLGTV